MFCRLLPHLPLARTTVALPFAINNARLKHHSSDRRNRVGGGKRKATSFDTNTNDSVEQPTNDSSSSSDYDIFNDK